MASSELHSACYGGDINAVRRLLRDYNGSNESYSSAFVPVQASEDYFGMDIGPAGTGTGVSMALYINQLDAQGWTPLHKACSNGHREVGHGGYRCSLRYYTQDKV